MPSTNTTKYAQTLRRGFSPINITRKIPFSALKNEIKKYLLVYILTNPADISFILFFEAEKGIIPVLFRGLKPLP